MTYRKLLRNSAVGFGAIVASIIGQAKHAEAYPIDCAILLCLSGGWPSSAECTAARTVFIRRITPWPIEPPLQIWRCPMKAAYTVDPETLTSDRIYEILMDGSDAPLQSYPAVPLDHSRDELMPEPAVLRQSGGTAERLPEGFLLQLIQDQADIDISEPAFDFVRSIKVWDVRRYSHREHGKDDDCEERYTMRLGTYGTQGDFHWAGTTPGAAPSWVIPNRTCSSGNWRRGVGVEWRDYEGHHGYEWVSY